ncbi:hypothetical protein EHQ99_17560 [Leptospira bouyouniensis]|nr:hypothetical protein EHQ99_17560 [Leptospira bouyouniensis]
MDEKTKVGKIEWQSTNRKSEFITSFGNSFVTIDRYVHSFKAAGVEIPEDQLRLQNYIPDMIEVSIRDDKGKVIEQIFIKRQDPLFVSIDLLYELIKRSISKADIYIEEILKKLKDQ